MFLDLKCKDCGNTWTTAADEFQNRRDIDDPDCPICGSENHQILVTHKEPERPEFDTGCTYDDGPKGKDRKW